MTYVYDLDLSTKHYEIKVSTNDHYGYFEHHELGDESAGGLWFADKELIDYDGVFELPKEVAEALKARGYWDDDGLMADLEVVGEIN